MVLALSLCLVSEIKVHTDINGLIEISYFRYLVIFMHIY